MRPAQMDSLGSISEDPPVDLHRAGVYLPTVRMAPVPPLLLLKMATCQTRPRCGNRLNLSPSTMATDTGTLKLSRMSR